MVEASTLEVAPSVVASEDPDVVVSEASELNSVLEELAVVRSEESLSVAESVESELPSEVPGNSVEESSVTLEESVEAEDSVEAEESVDPVKSVDFSSSDSVNNVEESSPLPSPEPSDVVMISVELSE